MCRHGLAQSSQCGEQGPNGDNTTRTLGGCLGKGSHWTGWLSLGDRRQGVPGNHPSSQGRFWKAEFHMRFAGGYRGLCSASTGTSCQESGNSHKKGISPWMGKEQHKTSWQRVGGTAKTEPPTAPCLPAVRPCHHTGSRDLTAHGPQQQIFPKGEAALTDPVFPMLCGHPRRSNTDKRGGGKGTSPPTCSPGRG